MAAKIIIRRETNLDIPDIIFGNNIVYVKQVLINFIPGCPVVENIRWFVKKTMFSIYNLVVHDSSYGLQGTTKSILPVILYVTKLLSFRLCYLPEVAAKRT